jgi:hypothetical protein
MLAKRSDGGVQLRGVAEARPGRQKHRVIVVTTILFLSISTHSSERKSSRDCNEGQVVFAIVPSKRKTGAGRTSGGRPGYTPAAMNGMTDEFMKERAQCGR